MSWRIVDEVLTAAPTDLSLSERLALVVLAHHADDGTRECWPGIDKLVASTSMHADTLRRVITRLEKRGLVRRVQRPSPGRRTVYGIPRLHHPDAASYQSAPEHPDAPSAHSTHHPDAASYRTPGRSVGTPERSVREHPDAASYPVGQEPKGEGGTPPPVCPRHPNGNPTDQPCRGCRDARLATLASHPPASRPPGIRPACPDCEDTGKILDPETKLPTAPARRCMHPRRPAA